MRAAKDRKFTFDRVRAAERLAEAKDFLEGQGIPLDVAQKHGLGVVDHPAIGLSIAIPYTEAIVKFRALDPRRKADKFRHLSGHPSSDLIYGIELFDDADFVLDPVGYVVESELDALTMESHGFNAVSVSSATSCLNQEGQLKFAKEVLEGLSKAERIFLALDMDAAGQRCADAFSKALPPYKTHRLTWKYGGKESGDPKDVGEVYRSELGRRAWHPLPAQRKGQKFTISRNREHLKHNSGISATDAITFLEISKDGHPKDAQSAMTTLGGLL